MGKLKSALPLLITGIVLILYIGLGGVIFHFIERDNESKVQEETKEFTGTFLSKFQTFTFHKKFIHVREFRLMFHNAWLSVGAYI